MGVGPTEKRIKIVGNWIDQGLTKEGVLSLLMNFLDGNVAYVPKPLLQFMDLTKGGLLIWIPFHMVYILEQIAAGIDTGKVNYPNREPIQKLADLFGKFKEAKYESGDGWEAFFVLTLLVRCLTGEFDALTDSFARLMGEQYQVTVNSPLQPEGISFEKIKNVDKLLSAIPKEVGKGDPRIAVYYPQHASFEVFDVLVVAWDADGRRFAVVGYQLKEGKGAPKTTAKTLLCDQCYLILGDAPKKTALQDGWTIPSEQQISSFFGESGKEWTPKKWKEPND